MKGSVHLSSLATMQKQNWGGKQPICGEVGVSKVSGYSLYFRISQVALQTDNLMYAALFIYLLGVMLPFYGSSKAVYHLLPFSIAGLANSPDNKSWPVRLWHVSGM